MTKRAYMEANKRWLEEKAKEAGVKCLAKGVMYKVIKQGKTGGRKSFAAEHRNGSLHGANHRRPPIRHEPGRCATGLPSAPTD